MNTTWSMIVLSQADGDSWAAVLAQPDDLHMYGELAVRLKAAGLKKMNRRMWDGGLWPLSKASVTVLDGSVTQAHTGRARLLCDPPLAATPGWREAAVRGRVVLGLLSPGVVVGDLPLSMDERADLLKAAAERGELLAGLAEVRDSPEPYGRRW
ncbi:hypothetical protein ABT282_31015 [Streptomyces sp. NPDC000927]|uniref:hypothetical protein n=1 Tax=Streptomyces sp. NPDC000927 TaxID=3154371 RepID=UPI0033279AB9